MRIQVVKGQTVRIALSSATTNQASPVEYVVRDFPQLGVLGIPQPTPEDRTLSTIIYQTASQSKGQLDVFSFSARYFKGYYSAPVQVIIDLVEPRPQIECPTSIDFGSVILGSESIREILLKNSGNIEFRKHIQFPLPLELIEPADGKVSIMPGHSAVLKISCRPEKVARFMLPFTFQEKALTTFMGNAFAPFTLSSKKLELRWNEKEQNRQGQVEISNKASAAISIKVSPPIRSQYLNNKSDAPLTNSPLVIPPWESRSVRIALPREDVQDFKGILKISNEQYTQDVLIEADASPARIHVELPDPSLKRIDFGAANPGTTISRTFMVKNLGGTGSVISLGALPPFRIAEKQASRQSSTYSLGPQSSAIFTVDFIAPAQQYGLYSDILELRSDVNAFSIQLTALVHAPNVTTDLSTLTPRLKKTPAAITPTTNRSLPAPASLPPLPDPENGEDHRSPSGFYTRDSISREYSNSIPAPTNFMLHKASRDHLTLGWKLPSPNHIVFEMEMRQMRMNQNNYSIESVWVPFHKVDFERLNGMIYASIPDLQPAAIYEFRVLTVGVGGKYSQPSQAFSVQTLPPPDYRWFKRLAWILAVSCLVLLLRQYWNKNDQSFPMPTYWPRTIPWPFE